MDLIDLKDDTILLIGSHLEANDLLNLALSCRHFGAKSDRYQHSLMEEVAMRQLTENATRSKCAAYIDCTPRQREEYIECIPRERGESWIGLYNWPEKMENWRALNNRAATGSRRDRAILMQLMASGDLVFGTATTFFCKGICEIVTRLATVHGLFVFMMGEENDGECSCSSGYYWPRTRDILMKEKPFRDTLVLLEKVFDIHRGVVSFRQFDWAYSDGECTGSHRIVISVLPGKEMRFVDGDKQCTLTMSHGAMVTLSNDAEKLIEKAPPPYVLPQSHRVEDCIIPQTDTSEPKKAYFLILDVSPKRN